MINAIEYKNEKLEEMEKRREIGGKRVKNTDYLSYILKDESICNRNGTIKMIF